MKKFVVVLGVVAGLGWWLVQVKPVQADGTYAKIGTAAGNDCGTDCINFSQGRVWTIDKYGKYIWLTEDRANNYHWWTWSNDKGAIWTQGATS